MYLLEDLTQSCYKESSDSLRLLPFDAILHDELRQFYQFLGSGDKSSLQGSSAVSWPTLESSSSASPGSPLQSSTSRLAPMRLRVTNLIGANGQSVFYIRRYRQAVAVHLGGRGAKLIVDKLHLRCLHVGLIRRLFPDARILFALRHPGDVVLSNFMQQYAPNDAFVHFDTLADSARVYARVLALWRLSLDVLPLQWDSVRYESLIEDPAGELARVSASAPAEPHRPACSAHSRAPVSATRLSTRSHWPA